MCIIVYKPKGKNLKKEVYENCFANNPDGAGFIIREKSGEIRIEKGFFTFQDFWEKYQPNQHKQAIVHFRITTHGDTNKDNCHPFWVNENKLAFAHNGVMNNIDCKSDYTMSDTWHFNNNILQHLQAKLGEDFIDDPVIQELIGEYIGASKLAFLHESGKTYLFNKSLGTMDDGVWYSNNTYRWTWKKKYEKEVRQLPVIGKEPEKEESNTPLIIPRNPQPVIPIRSGPPMSSTLRINDYIEMIQPYKGLRGNEMGLVKAFLQHGMIEAKMYSHSYPVGGKLISLPYGVFKKYSEGSVFQDDFNGELEYKQGTVH